MPKRQVLQRIDSTDIMGEDSYIKISPPTVQQQREYQKAINPLVKELDQLAKDGKGNSDRALELQETIVRMGADLFATHVIDWNWVRDAEGLDPFPAPKGNPDVFMELNQFEQQWITSLFQPDPAKKNT